jgi:hypothetical protein
MVLLDGIAIGSSMYLSNKGASSGGQAVGIIRRIASFNFPELRNNHADRTAWINLAMGYPTSGLHEVIKFTKL